MNSITSARDVIRLLDPTTIETIKNLFSGNLVTFEIFSRTLQTVIPQIYQIPSNFQGLAAAIVDLFEELDSDGDGIVTWTDFFAYYSQTEFDAGEKVKLPETQLIFKYIQKNSSDSSGKTGKIAVANFVENGGEFTDTPGHHFHNIHIYNDNYYLVTDTGVYQTDKTLSFPKTLFEPSIKNLQGEIVTKKLSDAKNRDLREKAVLNELKSMGVQGSDVMRKTQLQLKKEQENSMEEDSKSAAAEQHGSKSLAANQHLCSHVVASVLLDPLPYIVVATEYPVMYVVQITGQFGYTKPIELKNVCTTFFWDAQAHALFVGHTNGTVSKFSIKQIKVATPDVEESEAIKKLKAQGTNFEALNRILAEKSADEMTLQDLVQIYPDISGMLVGDHVTDLDRKKQEAYQQKIATLRAMKPSDIHIVELLTQKVFDPSRSTVETHGIDIDQVIRQDPSAYLEAKVGWYNASLQSRERKHGGILISLDIEEVKRCFVIDSSIRALVGGRGKWEKEFDENALRLTVAGSEGTIVVFDEDLQIIAAFPNLHPEGVIGVHCVKDHIVSVGYSNCLLIGPDVVQKAHEGYTIMTARQGDAPDLDDIRGTVQSAERLSLTLKNLDVEELLKGDLGHAMNLINHVEPPRPAEPIQFSFLIGNIVGVADHDGNLTLFHAVTGAHLTRTGCNFVHLLSSRFGGASYDFKADIGYITLGKFIYTIKAFPNEQVILDTDTWKIMKEQQNIINKVSSEDAQPYVPSLDKLPLGSISKNIQGVLFNEAVGEMAVITGDLEVTFFDYATGKPNRIFDIRQLDKELGKEDIKKQTEYTSIESNDQHQYFVNRSISKSGRNVPQVLDKIQQVDSILDYLGDQLLSMQLDSKSRILFLSGSKGIITVYWKSGLPFDYSQVGVIGKQQDMKESIIDNPFNTKTQALKKQIPPNLRVENKISISGMNVYSLMLDFSQLYQQDGNFEDLQRTQLGLQSNDKRLIFLMDSAMPQEVIVIATAPSAEYMSSPINSRIHTLIKLSENDDINQFDALFVMKTNYFKMLLQNPFLLGIEENIFKYDSLRWFLPNIILEHSPKNLNYQQQDIQDKSQFSEIIRSLCGQFESKVRIVTCICQSDALGLLAIGYNDGVILLVDTSSTLFARHLIIKQPSAKEIPSVLSLSFLGDYSLLVSTNSEGYVFVHSIRALKPNGQLLLCFQHSNYHIKQSPLFIDFNDIYDKYKIFVDYVLQPRCIPTTEYQQDQEGYDDTLFYIAKQYNPYQFSDSNLINIEQQSGQLQFYLKKVLEYKQLQQTFRPKKTDQIGSSMKNGVSSVNVMTQKHSYVQTPMRPPGQAENQQTPSLQMTSAVQSKQEEPQIGTVFDLFDDEEKETMMDYTPHFTYFALRIKKIFANVQYSGSSANSSSSASSSVSQQKQQKLRNKIRGTITIVSIFKNFILNLTNHPQQLQIAPSNKTAPIVKKLPYDHPLPAQTKLKYGQEKFEISEKTKKTIKELSRSRYVKKEQDSDTEVVGDAIIPLTDEQRHILYKTVLTEQGSLSKIPIRLILTRLLRNCVNATSLSFDQSTSRLYIGDELGFITSYNLEEFIRQSGVVPTTMQTKRIKQPGSDDLIVNAGYQEQTIHKQGTKSHGKSTPLFHDCVSVDYVFRAHELSVSEIRLNIVGKSMITLGEDKRVFCWDREAGTLQGMMQRVQLDQPADGWKTLFRKPVDTQPIFPYNQKFHKILPVPLRCEAPPPASYPWIFEKTEMLKMSKTFQRSRVICSTSISTGADDVLKKSESLLRESFPIPLEKDNIADVLLMSTGVTPERLNKYKDSWTMRAKLLRSTGRKLDLSQMTPDQALNSFKTRSVSIDNKRVQDNLEDTLLTSTIIHQTVNSQFKKAKGEKEE